MLKRITKIGTAISIALIIWICASYADIVVQNCRPNPTYDTHNVFAMEVWNSEQDFWYAQAVLEYVWDCVNDGVPADRNTGAYPKTINGEIKQGTPRLYITGRTQQQKNKVQKAMIFTEC